MPTLRFPNGCVASPHHLASAAGARVLAAGGNALDAAIAANLVLGVVTPYHCGPGGDVLALVWDGEPHAFTGIGAAPAAATVDAVRARVDSDAIPPTGPFGITVPGAVEGWFALLERFGSRSFGALASTAVALARDGFVPSDVGAAAFRASRERFAGMDAWQRVFGAVDVDRPLVRPRLADLLERMADQGPDGFYTGRVAQDIAAAVQEAGGLMTPDDLAGHAGQWVAPLSGSFRDLTVLELPPPTQGVTALTLLGIVDALGPLPADEAARIHLLLEAAKLALADRDAHLADPSSMEMATDALLAPGRLEAMAHGIDPDQATNWPPRRPDVGGTAYLCAADRDGLLVSLIQSNYHGFGSGVVVPHWELPLHDRGSAFSLDASHPNAIAPGRRPRHTLIPAMALRDGAPWLVFGTMGGEAQALVHLQVLSGLVDRGEDPAAALAAPRWVVAPSDGTVVLEPQLEPLTGPLAARGHRVATAQGGLFGHAHAIRIDAHGYLAASEPRTESAVIGH